ncbi:MAG TPA: hypothetical protein VI248_26620 [Kineosporiaceae bacterium]
MTAGSAAAGSAAAGSGVGPGPAHAEALVASRRLGMPPRSGLLRRLSKRPWAMHYYRLVATVLVVNALALIYGTRSWWFGNDFSALLTTSQAVLANFTLAILIRQQRMVNLLFWLATRAPTRWPLRIRWGLGKVYHFGGLHVGAALAGTAWYILHVWWLTRSFQAGHGLVSTPTLAVSYALGVILLAMVWTARPRARAKRHDRFELVHRFGGWTALALFWASMLLTMADLRPVLSAAGPGLYMIVAGQLLVLALLTYNVASPWFRLRRVRVVIERPSTHVAVARFDYGVTPFPGSSMAISRHPLGQWHAFANVPTPTRTGYRLTISRAGDWTGAFVDDPPSRVWVKGIPTAGVANIEKLFRKVVYLATGSGVGPCLPHLLAQEVPSHLIWVARSPRETYGDELVDEILAVQPDALIWDTTTQGKPDMVRLAYQGYAASGAEAVICISNKKLTWEVVTGLEQHGIPAFGAIWDS